MESPVPDHVMEFYRAAFRRATKGWSRHVKAQGLVIALVLIALGGLFDWYQTGQFQTGRFQVGSAVSTALLAVATYLVFAYVWWLIRTPADIYTDTESARLALAVRFDDMARPSIWANGHAYLTGNGSYWIRISITNNGATDDFSANATGFSGEPPDSWVIPWEQDLLDKVQIPHGQTRFLWIGTAWPPDADDRTATLTPFGPGWDTREFIGGGTHTNPRTHKRRTFSDSLEVTLIVTAHSQTSEYDELRAVLGFDGENVGYCYVDQSHYVGRVKQSSGHT